MTIFVKASRRARAHTRKQAIRRAARNGSKVAQAHRLKLLQTRLYKRLGKYKNKKVGDSREALSLRLFDKGEKARSAVKRKSIKGQHVTRGSYYTDRPRRYSKKYMKKR